MVDVGGGARESFHSLCVDESDAVLGAGKESFYSHSNPHHTPSPSSNWRHALLVGLKYTTMLYCTKLVQYVDNVL